jgi:hypothetical protein
MPLGANRSSRRWGRYRWRLWLLMIFGLAVATGLSLLGGGRIEEQCTPTNPCDPRQFGTTIFALLVAAIVAAPISATATAALSAAAAAAWLAGLGLAQLSPPAWLTALAVGYAAVSCWFGLRPMPKPSSLLGAPRGEERVPVALGPRRPWIGGSVVAILVAGCTVLLAWTLRHQSDVDAQERAASVVVASVVSHNSDEDTVTVRLPDDRLSTVHSVSPEAFPAGVTTSVYLDEHGLAELTANPYDISGLLFLAVTVACLALAYGLRRLGAYREALTFAETPQPVYDVRLVRIGDRLVIYPPGETDAPPVLSVAVQSVRRNEPEDPARTVLYGHPATGELIGCDDDGALLLGIRPARRPTRRLRRRLARRERVLVAARATAETFEASEPLQSDRDAGPSDLRTQTMPLPGVIVFTVVTAMWVPWAIYIRLHDHPLWTIAITLALSLAGMEFAWRSVGRPSVNWHAGGLTIVGRWRTRRLAWSDPEVSELLAEPPPGRFFNVPEKPRRRPSRFAAPRTGFQLRAALRHAYEQYGQVSPRPDDWPSEPPQVSPRRRPYWLILLWPPAAALAYELGPLLHHR